MYSEVSCPLTWCYNSSYCSQNIICTFPETSGITILSDKIIIPSLNDVLYPYERTILSGYELWGDNLIDVAELVS